MCSIFNYTISHILGTASLPISVNNWGSSKQQCLYSYFFVVSKDILNKQILQLKNHQPLTPSWILAFISCMMGGNYCLLYFLCFILQAVSTVFSTTSSWLFCLLLFKCVIHTYSTAKAQDSPCSLCRPS